MAGGPNEFHFAFLSVKLSARGAVALILSVPVAIVMIAAAWRILIG